MRPRLLDLFCGAGGASVGYHRAGFDVTGVDSDPRHGKRYPFPFVTADALNYVAEHGHRFAVITASPPCQAYSITRHSHNVTHPDLVGPTRDALVATGRPYVIENVVGAPLRDPLRLCGTEFGLVAPDDDGFMLELRRHRLFESNVYLYGAGGCQHKPITGHYVAGAYGGASQTTGGPAATRLLSKTIRHGGYVPSTAARARLLGIDWPMTQHELNQSIPPAYTQFIGGQLLQVIQ